MAISEEMQRQIDEINRSPLSDFITFDYDKRNKPCCPLCGSGTGKDRTSAFSEKVINGKYSYKCYNCEKFGEGQHPSTDTVGALCIIDNITVGEVIKKYGNGYKKETTAPRKKPIDTPSEPLEDQTEYYKTCQARIEEAEPYLTSRGISLETAKQMGFGFDSRWELPKNKKTSYAGKYTTPRLIIPSNDFEYLARITNGQKDYSKLRVGKFPMYFKAIRPGRPLFVCEGEIDAVSFYECGASAFGTASIGNKGNFINYIKKREEKDPIILVMDNDADKGNGKNPGQEAQKWIVEKLTEIGEKFIEAQLPEGVNDPNDLLAKDRRLMEQFIEEYEEKATELANKKTEKQLQIDSENAKSYQDIFLKEIEDMEHSPKLSTGLFQLDEYLGGGLTKGMYLLGGTSSSGKTTLLVQIADALTEIEQPVLFFSMEQDRQEIISKSISRISRNVCIRKQIDVKYAQSNFNIMNGSYKNNPYSREVVEKALDIYFRENAENMYIYERRRSTHEIEQKVREYIEAYGKTPVVFVDYLQLAEYKEPNAVNHYSDLQEINNKVAHLKAIVDKYKLTMVVISSLNRATYTNNSTSKPSLITLASFKGSGEIEYTADTVLALNFKALHEGSADYDEMKEKSKTKRELTLDILKQRNNPVGKTVDIIYEPVLNFFNDLPRAEMPGEEQITITPVKKAQHTL